MRFNKVLFTILVDEEECQQTMVDQIILGSHVDQNTFNLYLHENVPMFVETIESMNAISSTFSDVDTIYAKWKVQLHNLID